MFYPDALVRQTVARTQNNLANLRAGSFQAPPSFEERSAVQLDQFNRVWDFAVSEIPFYKHWRNTHRLPARISSFAELSSFPHLTKSAINENPDLVFGNDYRGPVYQTSGSTGEPTRFPASKSERPDRVADVWHYRRAMGLKPLNRYIYFGSVQTPTGTWLDWKRQQAHAHARRVASNSKVFSGYRLDEAAASEAVRLIKKFQPIFLVGFPSAISNIARNVHDPSDISSVRAIILSSEVVEDTDLADISTAFPGRKVAIEYGSEEIGVIAASTGTPWPIQTVWNAVHLSVDEEDNALVSTLTSRRFPLINYRLGDKIEPLRSEQHSVHLVNRVWGREQDVLDLPLKQGGTRTINAMGMIRILRFIQGVTTTQFYQDDESVYLFVVHDDQGSDDHTRQRAAASLREQYGDVDLTKVKLGRLKDPVRTARLKRRVVLQEYPREIACEPKSLAIESL